MRGAGRFFLGLWTLAGCIDGTNVALEESASDALIIAATTLGPHQPSAVTAFAASAGSIPLSAPEGESLVVFAIARRDLLTLEGIGPSDEILRSVTARARTDAAPLGSCELCFSGANAAALTIRPGESCPVPSLARAFVFDPNTRALEEVSDDPLAEGLRREIRIDWPGDCVPRPEFPAVGADFDEAPHFIVPQNDPWPIDGVAVTSGGAVGVFSEHFARVVEDGGEIHEDSSAPFPGRIAETLGLEDGTFVVAARGGPGTNNVQPVRFFRVTTTLESEPIPNTGTPFNGEPASFQLHPASMAPLLGVDLPPGGSLVSFKAKLQSRVPSLQVCALTDAMDCDDILGPGLGTVSETDGHAISSTGRVVVSTCQAILTGERVDGAWSWSQNGEVIDTENCETVSAAALDVDDRLFLCVNMKDGEDDVSAEIYEVPRDLSLIDQPIHTSTGGYCSGFVKDREDPRVLHVLLESETVTITTSSGAPTRARARPTPSVFGVNVSYAGEPLPGWTILFDGPRILVRGPEDSDFREIYGDALRPLPAQALVTVEEEIAVFEHGLSYFTEDGLSRRHELGAEWENQAVTSASWDEVSNSFLVSGFPRTGGPPWIRFVSPEGRVDREIETQDTPAILKAVQTDVGIIVAGHDEFLGVLRGDRIEPIEIEWDDPRTPDEEGPLKLDDRFCRIHGPANLDAAPEVLLPWRDIDSAGGSTWAVGCSGMVAEISVGPDTARAVRLAIPAQLGNARQPDFTAVKVVAPGYVLLGAEGVDQPVEETGRLFEIRPQLGGGPLALSEITDRSVSNQTYDDLGEPIGFVGANDMPVAMILSEGNRGALVPVSSGKGFRFPEVLWAWTVGPSGRLWVSSARGRLFTMPLVP